MSHAAHLLGGVRKSLSYSVGWRPAGTVAEGAPIIPISAQLKYNIEVVCEYIVKKIPVPVRDFTSEPRLIGEETNRHTHQPGPGGAWPCRS